jgi:hypothetical protein
MASIILGIEGHKQSGKDTFASRLTERRGYTRIAFADPLRDLLLAINPVVIPLRFEGAVRFSESPDLLLLDRFREAVETHLGFPGGGGQDQSVDALLALDPYTVPGERLTDVIPEVGWDYAKGCLAEVRRLLQRLGTESIREYYGDDIWVNRGMEIADEVSGPVVITDVRFPNEADAIKRAGGVLIRITRPDRDTSGDTAHASETHVDSLPADMEITNDTSIEDLWTKAEAVADAARRIAVRRHSPKTSNSFPAEVKTKISGVNLQGEKSHDVPAKQAS